MWLPPQSVRLAGGQPLQRGMLKQDSFVFSLALAPSINTVGTWLSVSLSLFPVWGLLSSHFKKTVSTKPSDMHLYGRKHPFDAPR